MSKYIVTCECGVKVRLPDTKKSRSFQCPRCKKSIALTNEFKVLFGSPLDISQSAVCPICQTDIHTNESCVKCPDCDQIHHQECWSEIGGCGTYGCQQAPPVNESDQSAQAPLTAWGDTKKCPACGEEIKSIALKCRYCSTTFDSNDPMSLGDLKNQYDRGERVIATRNSIIGIFVFSMIGILAPLALLISLIYIIPRKKQIAQAGPLISILSWITIGLNVLYTFLMFLFYLF